MDYMHENNVEYGSDRFPIEMLRVITIEFMNIPRNDFWRIDYLLKGDGRLILDIKSSPREKLKNALRGAYDYFFEDDSVIDREKKSEIDGLVEKIISELSDDEMTEAGYVIKKAEIEYIKRLGGNFELH